MGVAHRRRKYVQKNYEMHEQNEYRWGEWVHMLNHYVSTIANPHTRDAYQRDITTFLHWLESNSYVLEHLRPLEAQGFVQHIAEKRQARGVNRSLSAVRAYITWLVRTEQLSERSLSVCKALVNVSMPETLPHTISRSDISALLGQPDRTTFSGIRDYAFMRLLFSSGIRLNEALHLNIEDVQYDHEGGTVRVVGKGNKERIVFFSTHAAQALQEYGAVLQRKNGPLFVNESGVRISARWCQRVLRKYGDAVGLDIHPHLLRHTFATDLLEATGDIDAVSKLLGHKNLNTTRIYTAVATGRLRTVHATANVGY